MNLNNVRTHISCDYNINSSPNTSMWLLEVLARTRGKWQNVIEVSKVNYYAKWPYCMYYWNINTDSCTCKQRAHFNNLYM